MLVRRFIIVCLLFFIFGSGLSILVAETARPARSWEAGHILTGTLHMAARDHYIGSWKTESTRVQ